MRARTNGQVMVLSAVTMLLMALMLMLSFNLTNVVHEKIRLQQHSDAMAYSMATVEARTFNYLAYQNRATAAAAVSIMTLHAYYSSMTLVGDAFNAAMWAFIQIVGWEIAAFAACCPFCCVQHLPHAAQAGQVASRMSQQRTQYNNKLRGREGDFNRAVQMWSLFIDMGWLSGQTMIEHTQQVLAGQKLDSLKQINAPCSSPLATGLSALNVRNFACAMEGSPIDTLCVSGPGMSAPNVSPVQARSRVISNVANAARGDFPKNRGIPFPILFHPQTLQDLMQGIQSQGFTLPVVTGGSAKVMRGTSSGQCTGNANNQPGETICGVDSGFLTSFFIDTLPGVWNFSSEIYSNNNGGAHRPGGGHTGRHEDWKGFQRTDDIPACLSEGECFINFRSSSDANTDFNQPSVYGHFQQDLRQNTEYNDGRQCQRGAWELGTEGKLTLNTGEVDQQFTGNGVLDFVPREPGRAVSKAMVYYHRPDDWKMPPTTFDPYWKAKLHPFDRTELGTVLGASMDTDGAQMIAGPVEGRD